MSLATGRPHSFVPARTLADLLRLPDPDRDGWARNMAMHYLAGATAGTVRGVMSASNLRCPFGGAGLVITGSWLVTSARETVGRSVPGPRV